MNMTIEASCFIADADLDSLKEIQNKQAAIELWAYGIETSSIMGTVAFEFAIHQDQCWYELFQRFITIKDEEYAKIHIIKHVPHSSAFSSGFPFLPYERIYQNGEEISWTKIATICPPFSFYLFQDMLRTCNEAQDGTKTFRHKRADIALECKAISSSILLQITTHPYLLKFCQTEQELDDKKELWEFHFTEEEELNYFQSKGSREYFSAQRLVDFSRSKMILSERK